MELKKNMPLVVGILIPIVMIVFVTISVYMPQWLANPEYDFLYAVHEGYGGYKYDYQVGSNDRLTRTLLGGGSNYREPAEEDQLYVYSVKSDESEGVTYEEAAQLKLDGSSKSPDGYELVRGGSSGGGFFPFFYSSGSYGKYFLKAKGASVEISLAKGDDYYSRVKFIGWVND